MADAHEAEAARRQHAVWERIAPSFDATRQRPWTHVTEWIAQQSPGRMLDLMCGNGRHLAAMTAAGHAATAVDWSRALCQRAAASGVAVVQADAARLPFPDASFDAAVCVAGLPSVPTAALRRQVLAEARRVLCPGAPVQVTVWWREAARFAGLEPKHAPLDVVVPWRAGAEAQPRAYHLYTQDELRATLEDAGFAVASVRPVPLSWSTPDNLVAVARAGQA